VLDLPKNITEGSIDGLRRPGSKAPERPAGLPGLGHDVLDDFALDAGVPLDASASSLLEAIEKQIREDEARREAGVVDRDRDENTDSDETAAVTPAVTSPPHGLAPTAAVTPDGGYGSELPSDDAIPDALDPDPCKNASSVAALPGVVIGKTLGKQLNAGIGDCVQITSPTIGIAFGANGARPPIAKQFRVIALFEAGFDQYDSKLAYSDLYEAQQFYELGDSVTGVEMKVDDIDHAHAIGKDIDALLNNGVYRVMDWRELNRGLFTALLIQQIGMSCVLALIIIVAAFTVIATLIMIVLEKKKEIALLKALGAKSAAILRVFLYQGAIIGVIGTSLGLVVGYGGCKALEAYGFPLDPKVYFISKLPVEIRPHEFIITGVFAILICLVATIFPSLYAARLRPTDGLRPE